MKSAHGTTVVVATTPVAIRRGSIIHGLEHIYSSIEIYVLYWLYFFFLFVLLPRAGALSAMAAINGANAVINITPHQQRLRARRQAATTVSPFRRAPATISSCQHQFRLPFRHVDPMVASTMMILIMTYISGHRDQGASNATIVLASHDFGPSPICTPLDHRIAPILAIMSIATKNIVKHVIFWVFEGKLIHEINCQLSSHFVFFYIQFYFKDFE